MFNQIKNFLFGESNNNLNLSRLISNVKANDTQIKTDSWVNGLSGLGVHGRDKKVSTIFKHCKILSVQELDELYRADGLTKRIIDIIPFEMMRQGFEVDGDSDGIINGKLEELNAYCKITQLIQWARLYGGGVIVMGVADGRSLDEPVNLDNIYTVAWLQVFDKFQAQIISSYICSDLNDINYGFPDYYQITDGKTGTTFLVHHSRVLRMDWNLVPPRNNNQNNGWGDSAILSIYDELRNYGSAFANTSSMMQDFVNGILKIPNLSNTIATDCDGGSKVLKRLDFANLTKSVVNMMVLDAEETYEKLSTNVAGVADLIDRFMLSLSSVTGIPVTLLFGRSPAGLTATGDSDIRNFYDMIKQQQETKLKPILEKLCLYLFLSKEGGFNGIEPDNWGVQFTPLWQNTEEQEANMRRTIAEMDKIYIETGVLDADEVAESRFGGDRYSINTIINMEARKNGYDPEEIEALEEEKKRQIETMPPEAPYEKEQENIIIVDNKT